MGAMMNEDRFGVITFTFNPASVATITVAEQTVSVPGLKVGDVVFLIKPTVTAGLGICQSRVSAADTLAVQFVNPTAGAIDAASETYTLFWFRPEKTPSGAVNP